MSDRSEIAALSPDTRSLHARSLSDADVPALARLQGLTYLSFCAGCARNDITTGFQPYLAAITDHGLSEPAKLDLPKLDTPDIGHCDDITNDGILHVAGMEQLVNLLLSGTLITDDALIAIATMENLSHVDLRGCPHVTDRGLVFLERMSSLRTVCLGRCPRVTAAGRERLQAALPKARILLCEP